MARKISRPIPGSVAGWFKEIKLAIADAREAEPFGESIGQPVTNANLFHLAPLVCLKFRGRKLLGREANRVPETALANYVVNSDPDGADHGLESKPLLAFAVCYVTAHLALISWTRNEPKRFSTSASNTWRKDDEAVRNLD
jgi:hypothetical protein